MSDAARAARHAALLERMGRGRAHFRDVQWPGGAVTAIVRVRVPTAALRQAGHAAAHERFAALGLDPAAAINGEEFFHEVVTQFLARVLEDPARPIIGDPLGRCEPWFEDVDQARETFTHEERAELWRIAADLVRESDPDFPAETPAEEVAAILEALKKKDRARLKGFAINSLVSCMLSMACPPAT